MQKCGETGITKKFHRLIQITHTKDDNYFLEAAVIFVSNCHKKMIIID